LLRALYWWCILIPELLRLAVIFFKILSEEVKNELADRQQYIKYDLKIFHLFVV